MKGFAHLLNIILGGIILEGTGRLIRKTYFELIGNSQQKIGSFANDGIDSEVLINKLIGLLAIISTLLLLLLLTGNL